MPTKSKRKCQLEGARAAAKKQKVARSTHGIISSVEEIPILLIMSQRKMLPMIQIMIS